MISSPVPDNAPLDESGSMVRRMIVGVLFGVLVYAGIVLWLDAGAIWEALENFAWWILPAACGLSFANYALRFLKWERYRKLLNIELELKTSFVIYLSGLSMGVTPGKMGEVFKSWLIKRVNGTPIHKSAPIVVAERITDLFGFLILVGAGGLVSQPDYAPLFLATLALCVLGAFLCGSPKAASIAIGLVSKLPKGDRIAPKLEVAFESARVLLAPKEIIFPTLLSAASWGLECLAFLLIARNLAPEGADISLAFCVFAYAISAVAGAIAIIAPGGLGVTEGLLGSLTRQAYEPSLLHLGADAALATARTKAAGAVILTRVATLWFGVAVGLFATAIFKRMKR
ncbi:MAG: lysylphosphatidylglycerol synthase transmembrane domain-containing protein [Planctomycetota bacterium]|nr:lysylphosphatidylglycerol synthase transmembrane domain-containing protein [Planctomycetota bacterium]MDG2143946.1 lysylphosphatidylglycerol synthase transmembrane domain-containing protein [Planctomycetota bacterium]